MTAIATILLELGAQVAAPFAKKILAEHIGGLAGDAGGQLIDVVAAKLGVPAQDIPAVAKVDPVAVQAAIVAAEPAAAELVLAHVEAQKLGVQLQLAEMQKEPAWAWAWRPAWMWFLGLLWLWRLLIVPIADAAMGSAMAGAIEVTHLAWLTGLYAGLYMGGHTLKDAMSKWVAKPA